MLLSRYQKLCSQRITGVKGDLLLFYTTPFSDLNMLLNLLSMLNVVDFTVEGGVPSVEVTVNMPEVLEKEVTSEAYKNFVLENNEKIFLEQIELFQLFFGNTSLDDEQRWEFIEDYFTGMNVEEMKKNIAPWDRTKRSVLKLNRAIPSSGYRGSIIHVLTHSRNAMSGGDFTCLLIL